MLPNVFLRQLLGIIHTNESFMTTHCTSKPWRRSAHKVSWHNNHREYGLGSTYFGFRVPSHEFVFAPRSTKEVAIKLWYALIKSMQLLFGTHILKLGLTSGESSEDGGTLELQEVAQH